jgi:U6 snRNA-associated Sm-like protein LSm4
LRVPDTLLDVVKEEQSRARDAGRSTRGGGNTGPRGGSSLFFVSSLMLTDWLVWLQAVAHQHEVCFHDQNLLCEKLISRSGRGGRGGPVRGARGRGRGV